MNELIKALNSSDESDRLYAVEDIADTNDPAMALHLVDRLSIEKSQVVKDSIVFALKRMDCSKAYDSLFEMFISPDAYIRNAAVSIFGAGGNNSLSYLATRLDHSDKEVRKLILDAMAEIGTPESRLAIRALLNDDAPNVKITAVEYLGKLNDRASADDILDILESDNEPMLRVSILETLSIIGDSPHIKRAMEILIPGGDVRNIDPIYIPEITTFIAKSGELADIKKILGAIEDTVAYSESIVEAAAKALSRFGDDALCKEIVDRVLAVARNKDIREEVRMSAVELLLSSRWPGPSSDTAYDLGISLLEEGMDYSGIRLLAKSGRNDAAEKIKFIMKETGDSDIEELCRELMN